jgi:DNA-binding transcriptional LysR family regulator
VRLGVPHDVVGPYMPPVLKSFDQAWPGVRVSLDCRTSVNLLRALDRREVDLILTTERACAPHGETLLPDPLVWVGARDGRAYKRNPLPVSIGGEDCAFRPFAIDALNQAGRDWRPVCEISNMLAECAAVEADLAVVPLLASTVPDTLKILGAGDGLPPLPMFHINLYLPKVGASEAAVELARHIREQFAARYRRAA